MGEGRTPWASTLPLPATSLADFESGLWALAASPSGQLLVTGSEEGCVAAWDLRTRQQIWASQVRITCMRVLRIARGCCMHAWQQVWASQ